MVKGGLIWFPCLALNAKHCIKVSSNMKLYVQAFIQIKKGPLHMCSVIVCVNLARLWHPVVWLNTSVDVAEMVRFLVVINI